MAKIHQFRRLRHGQTRRLSTPDFARRDQAHDRGRRLLGLAVLAALIVIAVLLLNGWL
jgi:hypothetical protein